MKFAGGFEFLSLTSGSSLCAIRSRPIEEKYFFRVTDPGGLMVLIDLSAPP